MPSICARRKGGGEVERYFREGETKEVADYCKTDVVGTYQVWLRYELFRGTLSQDAFETSQRDFVDFMNRKSEYVTLGTEQPVEVNMRAWRGETRIDFQAHLAERTRDKLSLVQFGGP